MIMIVAIGYDGDYDYDYDYDSSSSSRPAATATATGRALVHSIVLVMLSPLLLTHPQCPALNATTLRYVPISPSSCLSASSLSPWIHLNHPRPKGLPDNSRLKIDSTMWSAGELERKDPSAER